MLKKRMESLKKKSSQGTMIRQKRTKRRRKRKTKMKRKMKMKT
jgi:hypothetical protein